MITTEACCVACGGSELEAVDPVVNEVQLYQCANCTLKFVPLCSLDSRLNYDQFYNDEGLYANKLEEVDLNNLPLLNRTRRDALKQITALRPSTLLEIGCGTGAFLARMEKLGIDCAGVEPSSNAARAADNLLKGPVRNEFFCRDSFADRTFDVICVWEVIEHVHDLRDFATTIYERLNPGGRVFMSTPNYESSWMWKDMPRDPMSAPPVHVTFWNERSYRRFLDEVSD